MRAAVDTSMFMATHGVALWAVAAAFVMAAGSGVVSVLAQRQWTRMVFALCVAFLLIIPNVPIKWDCGDLPWWLCWL